MSVNLLLYTYWDLHTEKPQSKFSFANRCKPIKRRVSLFPHPRKVIRPIRSRVSCFFTCEPYGKLKFPFKAWLARFRTPHKPSLCESEKSKWFLFAFLPSLILKVPVSAKQKQKGGGKEFEMRSQTQTKQPWTQISQLYFISFGFYLSSFAFYEAAFFQWLRIGSCLACVYRVMDAP